MGYELWNILLLIFLLVGLFILFRKLLKYCLRRGEEEVGLSITLEPRSWGVPTPRNVKNSGDRYGTTDSSSDSIIRPKVLTKKKPMTFTNIRKYSSRLSSKSPSIVLPMSPTLQYRIE